MRAECRLVGGYELRLLAFVKASCAAGRRELYYRVQLFEAVVLVGGFYLGQAPREQAMVSPIANEKETSIANRLRPSNKSR